MYKVHHMVPDHPDLHICSEKDVRVSCKNIISQSFIYSNSIHMTTILVF